MKRGVGWRPYFVSGDDVIERCPDRGVAAVLARPATEVVYDATTTEFRLNVVAAILDLRRGRTPKCSRFVLAAAKQVHLRDRRS
jgi:hypothetical protein